jgi:hypothetical protein
MERACMKNFFGKNSDKIEIHVIEPGTILYSGVDPAHVNIPANSTSYKYFTKNKETAEAFARTKKGGRVQKYQVVEPVNIYVQSNPDIFYYNTPEGYSSPEAQCLIHDGYHGYATKMQNNGIEDIGLADISSLVKMAKNGGKRKTRKRKSRNI